MNPSEVQAAIQKVVNILHLFHTSLHDFDMMYIDNNHIHHIIYDAESSDYQFDSIDHPEIEEEDLDEIDRYFQEFLDDRYYSFFTADQVLDITNHLDITKGADNITRLTDYLNDHPNQIYRLFGYTNGLVTGIDSAKRTFLKEDLEITYVDHYILDDGDGKAYGKARGYPYRELLKYKDTDMFNILPERRVDYDERN